MSEIHIGLASRAVRQPGAPLHRAHERRCDSAEHRLDNKLSFLPRRAVAVEMCCSLLAAQKPSGTLRQGPWRLAELLCRAATCGQCAEWLSVAHKWGGWVGWHSPRATLPALQCWCPFLSSLAHLSKRRISSCAESCAACNAMHAHCSGRDRMPCNEREGWGSFEWPPCPHAAVGRCRGAAADYIYMV